MRQVNLYNYLPEYMHEYLEIKCILNMENTELTKQWYELERAFNNTFIFTADEYGISLFEKMMGIYRKKDKTLEDRRRDVYIKWNARQPYTWRWLENFLKLYFMNTQTNGTPVLDNNKYHLDIRLKSQKEFGEYEYNLFNQLRDKIPANLTMTILGVLNPSEEKQIFSSALVYRIKKKMEDRPMDQVSIGHFYTKTALIYKMKRSGINV